MGYYCGTLPAACWKRSVKVLIIQRFAAAFRKTLFEQIGEKVDLSLIVSDEAPEVRSDSAVKNVTVQTSQYHDFLAGAVHIQRGVIAAIETLKPETVVLTPTPRNLTNFAITRHCRRRGVRVVGWGMGRMPNRPPGRQKLHDLLVGALMRRLDHMICYSSAAKAYYMSLGMPRHKLSIAYNGIDTLEDAGRCAKNSGTATEGRIEVIAVGRLIPQKNFEILIEALGGQLGFHLNIVGDGAQRKELEELAANRQCSVTFHGYKAGEDLRALLTASDVFVLPSLGGLAIHEAMLAGCPVICGTADGTEYDLVVHGRTGFHLQNMTSKELRAVLVRARNGEFDLVEMGTLARRFVLQRRSRPQLLRSFLAALAQ